MSQYTVDEVVNGCKKQDRVFQEYLYRYYYSMFLKVCARYAKDMMDAEQLLNDGFLRVFSNIHTFENKGSFEGWMRKIMVNTCLDYLRSKYFKDAQKIEAPPSFAEDTYSPVSNDAINKIEFKELIREMQALPHVSRTVFNLFVFEGYTHKEIAIMMDMSEGTSHWHVHHARKALQERLKKRNAEIVKYEQK